MIDILHEKIDISQEKIQFSFFKIDLLEEKSNNLPRKIHL